MLYQDQRRNFHNILNYILLMLKFLLNANIDYIKDLDTDSELAKIDKVKVIEIVQ